MELCVQGLGHKYAAGGGLCVYNQVTPYLHDGAVLLLHAVSSDNANALEDIINYAKKNGGIYV